MKAAGAACILLGGLLGRFLYLRERTRRRRALGGLREAFLRMAEEIRQSRPPLPRLLARLAEECGPEAAPFLRASARGAGEGEDLGAVWRAAAERLPLEERERRTVLELAGALRGDEAQLCRALLAAAERLERRGREMDEARSLDERRSAAASLSAAALLAILLW